MTEDRIEVTFVVLMCVQKMKMWRNFSQYLGQSEELFENSSKENTHDVIYHNRLNISKKKL